MTMNKYNLNVHFSEEELKVIAKAYQKVVLVKHSGGDTDSSVAWVSFKPFQHDTVDWETHFAIYASNTEVCNSVNNDNFNDEVFVSPNMIDLPEQSIECFANDDDNCHIDVTTVPTNIPGSPELESLSLTTDSGELLATVNIPKDVIEKAEKFSVIYDEDKKEYYLQVE